MSKRHNACYKLCIQRARKDGAIHNSDRSSHGMRKAYGLTESIAVGLNMNPSVLRDVIRGLRVSGALLAAQDEELKA